MKNFTKIALIVTLVLVILGSICCAIGLGIGYNFSEISKEVGLVELGKFSIGPIKFPFFGYGNSFDWDDEEDWESNASEQLHFPWEDIENLELDVSYGTVEVIETKGDELYVDVEYRKENSRRKVDVSLDGDTLKIEETGSKRGYRNDSTRIYIRIPEEMLNKDQWKDIELSQSAGSIYVDVLLTAKNIHINVDAGECVVHRKLTAREELTAEVGTGEMKLQELEAKEVELNAGVGELTTGVVTAENMEIDCGIGNIETVAAGTETDYSYEIECKVGEVEIGGKSYSGLNSEKKVKNQGSRNMEINCGVGNVEVRFSGESGNSGKEYDDQEHDSEGHDSKGHDSEGHDSKEHDD